MAILILVGFLFGMLLGHFFKWFILLPAGAIAIILTVAGPITHTSILASAIQFGALTVGLQLGYVAGLVILLSIEASNSASHKSDAVSPRLTDRNDAFKGASQALASDILGSGPRSEDHRHSLPSGAALLGSALTACAALAGAWNFSL